MRSPYLWSILLLTVALAFLLRFRFHLHALFAWLVAVNATTFLLFLLDKAAAVAGIRRVRETTLHFFALLGGSPAALAVQTLLRHKVSKRGYLLSYWLIVALQLALVYAVLYTDLLKATLF